MKMCLEMNNKQQNHVEQKNVNKTKLA